MALSKKEKQKRIVRESIKKAIELFGTQKLMADAFKRQGYTYAQSHISSWLNGVLRVTPDAAAAIDDITGGEIDRETLCPEVFKRKSKA